MPNLTFRNAVTGGTSAFTGATSTATVPSGTAQDDLGEIWYSTAVLAPATAPTHTTPTGWSLGGSTTGTAASAALNLRVSMFYRNEPASPASASLVASVNSAQAWARESHSNSDTSAPFGQVTWGAWSGTSVVATGITTTKANAMVNMMVVTGAAQLTTPDGSLTERFDDSTNGIEGADGIQAVAGATGNKTATPAATADGIWALAELWSSTAAAGFIPYNPQPLRGPIMAR